MEGFIKITVEPAEGGSISRTEVELKDVSFADKTCMLNAFLKSLQITPSEAALHLLAIRSGYVSAQEQKEDKPNE